MKKFLVLYTMPIAGLEAWMQKPEEERKGMEEKMRADWVTWMRAHASALKETGGAGKTKRVTATGIEDVKNNIMLYSMIEAPSHEEASQLFVGHPHLGIPEASIDIMPVNELPGMTG